MDRLVRIAAVVVIGAALLLAALVWRDLARLVGPPVPGFPLDS
jgi:hypothetical protein